MPLAVVKLENPLMCAACRFHRIAVVHLRDGEQKVMRICSRLDCDNWDGYDYKDTVESIDSERTENQ